MATIEDGLNGLGLGKHAEAIAASADTHANLTDLFRLAFDKGAGEGIALIFYGLYLMTTPTLAAGHVSFPPVEELRARTLALGPNAGASERTTILALLGSIERAELLIRRIDAERKSVDREAVLATAAASRPPILDAGLSPQPA